jgi:transcriptional regulator with XRE-family HTH domain
MKEALNAYMAEKGISQNKLAELIGKSVKEVSRWRNGHVNPTLETRKMVARKLKRPLKGFL